VVTGDIIITAIVLIMGPFHWHTAHRYGPALAPAVLFLGRLYGILALYAVLGQLWWIAFVLTVHSALCLWLWWHQRGGRKHKGMHAFPGNKARAVRARMTARQRTATRRPRPAPQPV
jgi:hypothetical protein